MTELNEKQQQALVDFKAQADLLERDKYDPTCLRFLRARQYDVPKAVEMYNLYAKWRADNNVDNVLKEPFSVPRANWLHAYHGQDKLGRPVFIDLTGTIDAKQIVDKLKIPMDQVMRGHIKQQEILYKLYEQYTEETGQLVDQTLIIMDLQDASVFRHLNGPARGLFSGMATLGQNYYPERMGKLLIVNAPRAFPMAWNFIKGFLDVNTQNKLEVMAMANLKTRMLELIDAKNLPKRYGGDCDCEANGCFTKDPILKGVELTTGSINAAATGSGEEVESEESKKEREEIEKKEAEWLAQNENGST